LIQSGVGIKLPALKPHQEQFCKERIEACFANGLNWDALTAGMFCDMGTGKTPPTVLLMEWVKHILKAKGLPEGNWPCLIICPATAKYNWKNEFHRFAPWVKKILVVDGTREERDEQLSRFYENEYIITNYETIRIHQHFFQSLDRVLGIAVDEAHAIKNREAKRSVAIKAIDCKFRLALTGTPITNKPNDLWSILHFLNPGPEFYRKPRYSDTQIRYRGASPEWQSYFSFCSRYCEWENNRYSGFPKIIGGKNLDELHRKLIDSRIMVRWRRSEVLDLEPIIYKYIPLEATDAQARLYSQLRDGYISYVNELGRLDRKQVRSVLAQLTYFRRATTLTPKEFGIATGPIKFAPDLEVPISDEGAKQQWLLSFIDGYLDGEKVLIFSDWTACTRNLTNRLKRHRIKVLSIDGSTPHEERFAIQEQFNDPDDKTPIFIGSPAAFEVLNLQAASYVVFMNLPWRPKDVFQAYSRAHRFGQEKQVTVIFPFISGTIDEKMSRQLERKQRDIDLAIDNGEIDGAKLFKITTKQQILDLI